MIISSLTLIYHLILINFFVDLDSLLTTISTLCNYDILFLFFLWSERTV